MVIILILWQNQKPYTVSKIKNDYKSRHWIYMVMWTVRITDFVISKCSFRSISSQFLQNKIVNRKMFVASLVSGTAVHTQNILQSHLKFSVQRTGKVNLIPMLWIKMGEKEDEVSTKTPDEFLVLRLNGDKWTRSNERTVERTSKSQLFAWRQYASFE